VKQIPNFTKTSAFSTDKVFVSRFLDDAENLFEAAAGAGKGGESNPTDLAITVSPTGAIQITEAWGWAMHALQAHAGARTVYRVSRNSAGIRVEGRNGSQSCLLESESPAVTAYRLLNAASPYPANEPKAVSLLITAASPQPR
jgi:hypothetical protein